MRPSNRVPERRDGEVLLFDQAASAHLESTVPTSPRAPFSTIVTALAVVAYGISAKN